MQRQHSARMRPNQSPGRLFRSETSDDSRPGARRRGFRQEIEEERVACFLAEIAVKWETVRNSKLKAETAVKWDLLTRIWASTGSAGVARRVGHRHSTPKPVWPRTFVTAGKKPSHPELAKISEVRNAMESRVLPTTRLALAVSSYYVRSLRATCSLLVSAHLRKV